MIPFISLVHGGYSSWGSWDSCSVSCGLGQRFRYRACTNPPPQHGGNDCSSLGPSSECEGCNSNPCPSKTQLADSPKLAVLVSRAHDPSDLRQGSRALALSNTGSPRFTDFPSNLANLIGWEYETNTLRMFRKSGPARALDPCRRSEGSWLWRREWKLAFN